MSHNGKDVIPIADYEGKKESEAIGRALAAYSKRFGWIATIAMLKSIMDSMIAEVRNGKQ